jgi:small subunit ribosomal protein S1
VLDGVVKELRDFGAFVDLGGVEGMVHVSEVAYQRVAKPGDVLKVGDKVRVKVLKVETERGRPKIALSIKQAQVDPWDEIERHVTVSQTYTGKVANVMPFGAFVEIGPGIEGLVHVSEMSWIKRIQHPNELVKPGDQITVVVKDIDRKARRIALSMKALEADPWTAAKERLKVGAVVKAPVERLKSFGATVLLGDGITGMVPMGVIKKKFGEAYRGSTTPGKELEVKIVQVDSGARKVRLSLVGVDEDDADRNDYLDYLKAEQEKSQGAAAAAEGAAAGRTGSFGALLSAKLTEKKGR